MMYLYNGIKFPSLPDYDKSVYPCAFITKSNLSGIITETLWLVKKLDIQDVTTVLGTTTYVFVYIGDTFYSHAYYDYEEQPTKWGEPTVVEEDDKKGLSQVIWTNTDMYYPDGTLYLAASDPIPVSTWTPDPASLLMGYRVGQILRSIRGKKADTGNWQTIFDGEIVTELPYDTATVASARISELAQSDPHFTEGEMLAITYDGVRTVFTAQTHTGAYGTASYYVGDISLYDSNAPGEYGYMVGSMFSLGIYGLDILTPAPAGTHTVKIERQISV